MESFVLIGSSSSLFTRKHQIHILQNFKETDSFHLCVKSSAALATSQSLLIKAS